MSIQNAIAFLNLIENDVELQARAKTPADAARISSEMDLPFTVEELKQAGEERYADLSPEDLKTVAGGLCSL